MNILIYAVNYAPEPTGIGPNTTEFAEHLTGRGHSVEVVTTFPFYPYWRWFESPPLRRNEVINGVKVRRRRILLRRGSGTVWRIVFDSSFAFNALLAGTGRTRPDCIVAIAPPIQIVIPAAAAARRWRSPLILWVKDLPLEAAIDTGMMRDGLVVHLARWLERAAARVATCVVTIDRQFSDNLKRNGVEPRKLVTIPNWIDPAEISPRPASNAMRARLGAGDRDFLVLHTGNMGRKQGLENVVRAAGLVKDVNIKVAFTGDGPDRSMLESMIAVGNYSNVRLLPLQPAREYPDVLAAADLLILNQRSAVRDSVAPYKLLNYMAAGRPILGAVHPDSVAARLIYEAGCGSLVTPDDPHALATELDRMAESSRESLASLGAAGRKYAEVHWDGQVVLETWEQLILSVARPKPGNKATGATR